MSKMLRIARAEAIMAGVLKLVWSDGYQGIVDLRGRIIDGKIFAYIRDPDNFAKVRVASYGHSIYWGEEGNEEVDFSCDRLREIAEEQAALLGSGNSLDPKFALAVETLLPSVEKLLAGSPEILTVPHSRRLRGVYLFLEDTEPLYVGRSDHIRRRYSQHSNPGSRMHDAPFAVLLARDELGLKRAYVGKYVRKELAKDALFQEAFHRAKERIRRMKFRYVEEADPFQQMLLEAYCALALAAKYNGFCNT